MLLNSCVVIRATQAVLIRFGVISVAAVLLLGACSDGGDTTVPDDCLPSSFSTLSADERIDSLRATLTPPPSGEFPGSEGVITVVVSASDIATVEALARLTPPPEPC